MPIPSEELTITYANGAPAFISLPAGATVRDALAALPAGRTDRAWTYALAPLPGGQFVVARWIEVELLAHASRADITDRRLDELQAIAQQIDPSVEVAMGAKKLRAGELPGRFAPTEAHEQASLSMARARQLRDAHPGARLVVLSGGAVLGMFVKELLSANTLPADPFASRGPAVLGPESSPPVLGPSDDPAAGAEPDQPAEDNRTINGWIEGAQTAGVRSDSWRVLRSDEALLVGAPYELKFDIDAPRATALVTGGNVRALAESMQDAEELELLVEISVDKSEFAVYGRKNATIFLPKRGPSLNRVTFSLTPLKAGKASVKALIYARDQLFQEFTLNLTATDKPEQARPGAVPGATLVQQTGLDVGTAVATRPAGIDKPRISLVIVPQTTGYEFILSGPVVKRAFIPVSPETVMDQIASVRKTFLDEIVMRKDEATQQSWPYLMPDTMIAEAEHQKSLKTLARLGRRMWNNVFQSGEGGADAEEMGQLIRSLSQQHELSIQVVANRFNFPWAMLYDREEIDPPAAEGFWGFKHIVQYMPEFRRGKIVSFSPKLMGASGKLPMAFVFDAGIDGQFNVSVVKDQRSFIGGLSTVTAQEVESKDDLFDLLGGTGAPPLIYFYCHAESMLPGEQGKDKPIFGVDASYVTVTKGGKVTLQDMKDEAPIGKPPFTSAPFVFLNACQGAEMGSKQYDGLLPYFIARGARGAIGTEVNTPVHFGAEFGRKFVEGFAKGDRAVGEVLLDLRKWYLTEQRNVCGLVYALHSSGDLYVERGS